MIELTEAEKPGYLKIGCFGHTGTGKTWTMVQLLSQFIRDYVPDRQLAMFDTEKGSGYVGPIVQRITGKPLLVIHSQSFGDLLDFASLCAEKSYVAILDSATHPWRNLCADYLDAKRSRVKAVGGNPETVRLALADWGPIKEMWARFADRFRYDPVHWCICGREGDVWDTIMTDEGTEELRKTGVKMKTEVELGYEPSLLCRMTLNGTKHECFVVKERFGVMNGTCGVDPDITFFKPHIDMLNLAGDNSRPGPSQPVFEKGTGPNWETIKARREAILEGIRDDLLLAYPSQTKEDKTGKVVALRNAFRSKSVTWTELEKDHNKWPEELLQAGRTQLQTLLEKSTNGKNGS